MNMSCSLVGTPGSHSLSDLFDSQSESMEIGGSVNVWSSIYCMLLQVTLKRKKALQQ